MRNGDAFPDRLARYLERLSRTYRYAVEVRNRNWTAQPLLNLLRKHRIALVLVDQVWMPTITQLAEKLDVLTAHFTYIRWIGDRKGIEQKTKTWDKIIINRERETHTSSANSSIAARLCTRTTTIITPASPRAPSPCFTRSGTRRESVTREGISGILRAKRRFFLPTNTVM